MLDDGEFVKADTSGEVGAFFCEDPTHFSREGALGIAELVAEAVREQGIGLAHYLK